MIVWVRVPFELLKNKWRRLTSPPFWILIMTRREDLNFYKENILSDISKNLSIKELLEKYNIDYISFQSFLKNNGINYHGNDISKNFLGNKKSIKNLRKYLIDNHLKENKCEICGISYWNNKEIIFHVHHIDGNHFNNSLDNLQLLCPNCHSQTDNYCKMKISKNKEEDYIKIKENFKDIQKYILDRERLKEYLKSIGLTIERMFSLIKNKEEYKILKNIKKNEKYKIKKIEEDDIKNFSKNLEILNEIKELPINFKKYGWKKKVINYIQKKNYNILNINNFLKKYDKDFYDSCFHLNNVNFKKNKNSQYGKCWITKNNISKIIKKEKLEEYQKKGWSKGRKITNKENIIKANQNKIWIHKDDKEKRIFKEDLKMFIGWTFGRKSNKN